MTVSPKQNKIQETFSYGIIYIYTIPDESHKGRLKIGSTTIDSSDVSQDKINSAAHKRIKLQTKTADVPYNLLHAELALTENKSFFSDYDVHQILKRSQIERKPGNTTNTRSEWFEISLDVALAAIRAVKEGRKALSKEEKQISIIEPFQFRPNQLEAIALTTNAIKQKRKHFLWNAKMRFGKTSAAMKVAKDNSMKRVLIVTHRPSVNTDWHNDFTKVLSDTDFEFVTKTYGENISTLINKGTPFVYFASLQDLRLSKRVVSDELSNSNAEGFNKNDEVFDTEWDMLIVDEAHEGTQSDLGDATFSKIQTNFTLQLSGTPFNILHKHEENDIYTWDYVMEQDAKQNWEERNPGIPNPYAELPSLNMFTYDINKFAANIGTLGEKFHDSLDGAFKFHEFFRVKRDESGNELPIFVYEEMVRKFIDLLVDKSQKTLFPYSTDEYREYIRHSLWLLPNRVKVIEAMELLLKDHWLFGSGQFGIVNISGNNQDDANDKDAKDRVINAINKYDYTITLTGQRLTTGASIPE